MSLKILVSAGEASGDLYASEIVEALRRLSPGVTFFGCTGPRMQKAGVKTIVDSASLSVVGLVEVIRHIPRIYGEFRKMVRAAEAEKPDLAILTDSPDFHLRLAKKLQKLGVPVIYLIAPQVWAWREGRLAQMRRSLKLLLCIFPFEEAYFRRNRVEAAYIGHPLTRIVRPTLSKDEFFRKHGLDRSRPLVTILPGSRVGEVARHLSALVEAAALLPEATCLLAAPAGFSARAGSTFFKERINGAAIQILEGETWDAIAHADVALAASGTVTIEAALLGTPMVTFYRVAGLSWLLGRFLVRVPFYSMVNLIAGRMIVPELMQDQMTGVSLAETVSGLLQSSSARSRMQQDLAEVADRLSTRDDPMERAAVLVNEFLNKDKAHGG
ncbi:MAG: lipid-A-disaccharide synthase [Bryobacteraceae bacterium]